MHHKKFTPGIYTVGRNELLIVCISNVKGLLGDHKYVNKHSALGQGREKRQSLID